MINNSDVASGLKQARIPASVINTTLAKENQLTLRAMIKNQTFILNGEAKGVLMYPMTRVGHVQARKVFYLVAKEMYLSGFTVYCASLMKLISLLKENEYDNPEYETLVRARVIFVLDFYEQDCPMPLSPYDAAIFRSFVRDRFDNGSIVSFLSDAKLDKVSDWWTAKFLAYIENHTTSYGI